MKLHRTQLSILSLTLANLSPLVGVLFFGWDAAVIVFLYWTENLIIGAYNILRMISLKVEPLLENLWKLIVIPLFCIHFGAFCIGHGYFLLLFFDVGGGSGSFTSKDAWPGPFVIPQHLVSILRRFWEIHPTGMEWPVIFLVVSHGISFVQHHLWGGEYRSLTLNKLTTRPYRRIFLFHVAIIASAGPIMKWGSPVPLLCVLVILKLGLDVWLHIKSHRLVPSVEADQGGQQGSDIQQS